MTQWFWYAVAAMAFIGLSNFVFKLWTRENAFNAKALLPLAAFLFLGFVAALCYAVFVLNAKSAWVGLLIALFALSAAGFALMFLALQKGKVAMVTAILSLSTILVAMLSFVFLGDRFAVKELMALGLALLALFFLVV